MHKNVTLKDLRLTKEAMRQLSTGAQFILGAPPEEEPEKDLSMVEPPVDAPEK